MTIFINTPRMQHLAAIIGEFVAHRASEFKVYLDGQRGGWTIEFESDYGIAGWQEELAGFSGTAAWEMP